MPESTAHRRAVEIAARALNQGTHVYAVVGSATSRFAHYLKIMARDMIGSFKEAGDVESDLNRWINNYVNSNESAGAESKARFPLREANIEVKEIPGKPGAYRAVAFLKPHFQLDELSISLRLVADLPAGAK